MNPGQFIVPAAACGFAFLSLTAVLFVVALVVVVVRWCRDRRDRRHDVGPDALRLLEELDGHLDAFAADDPEVQAGLARLRAAVRDEQQNGGTS